MTIECYEAGCPFHSCHHGGEGPFCDEEDCQFSNSDMTEKAKKKNEPIKKTCKKISQISR